MADLKISELSALAGSNLVAADELAIVDDSASETKKITVSDLIANGVTVISDDTIPGAKILFGAGDIATAALADAAVTTAKVADDAITAAKLGNESTVDLVTTLPGAGGFTGQLALDTTVNKLHIWDGSAWQSLKAAGSVNTVSGSTTGEINIVSSVSGDTVTLSATIDDTTSANQFLAGPTGAAGAIGYRVIDGSDLPVATSSAKGGVVVNGEGLRMDVNTIEVDNDITASATHHVVTYNAKGLITGGRVLAASDLPIATTSAVGGVIPSTGLTVDGSGNLTIDNSVTADTYTKVTVAATGLVTAGSTLAAGDLPNHSADLLTSGNIPLARIADNLVTGAKLADYASAKIGETNPTADYIGQLFFNPLTRDLSLWDGNVFQPIGISAGEIVFAGTYNATTNLLSSVTSDGTGAGFVVGQALPAASGTNKNFYVVVDVGGTGTSPAPAVALAPPDFVLSTGTEYKLIDVSETVTAQVASNVGFTPVGTIAANNVQTAIAEVDTEKVAKSGDTMTGNLELNNANIVFEGSTENANETTLTVVDPTADRTITLPDVTGTVVTTGDTGTVTSTMLTDGTIVNADINASAEIAVSKLANGTARQLLQTASNGSDVEFTSNVDVPGTLDVTGAATLDSTLGVAGLISANGKVSFPLGSASAPSLLPGTDTNTGIFSPGADALAITTGGTQRVIVDSSGNVGIGTSSPSNNLDILSTTSGATVNARVGSTATSGVNNANLIINNGGTGNATLRFDYESSTNSASIGVPQSTQALFFTTAGSERLRIDSSGRVGIGTTTPGNMLHISGASPAIRLSDSGANGGAFDIIEDNNGLLKLRNDAGNSGTGSGIAFDVDSAERMRIDSSGRLLVGTSSTSATCTSVFAGRSDGANDPVLRLEVNSTAPVNGTALGGLNFASSGLSGFQAGARIAAVRDGGTWTNGSSHPTYLEFATTADGASSPTERMRIDSAGDVEIGGANYLTWVASPGGTHRGRISCFNNDSIVFQNTSSDSERMRIDSSGRLLVGTSGSSANVSAVFHDNSASNGPAQILLATSSTTPTSAEALARIHFSATNQSFAATIEGSRDGGTWTAGSSQPSKLTFSTTADGASSTTERLRIDSSGKVYFGNFNDVANAGYIDKATTGDFELNIVASRSTAQNRNIVFKGRSNTEAMRIDSSGRLLVGASTSRSIGAGAAYPARLQVESSGFTNTSFTQNSNDEYGPEINLGKSRGTSAGGTTVVQSGDQLGIIQFAGADGTDLETNGAAIECRVDGTPGSNDMPGRLSFYTTADGASSPTERMRIASSGLSDIYGSSSTLRLRTGLTGTSGQLLGGFDGATSISNGTQRIAIYANGNVVNTNNSYGSLSDAKLKENIVNASSQWDDLKAIQVRNYNFIEGQTHTQIGVVAQEVETVSPGLVTESPDTDDDGNDLGTVTKSVNYSVLYMKAVKALQEAMERIETLEQRLTDAGIA